MKTQAKQPRKQVPEENVFEDVVSGLFALPFNEKVEPIIKKEKKQRKNTRNKKSQS